MGEDEGASALRGRRTVEEVERFGDDGRRQNVRRIERPPSVVDGLGVDVPVVAHDGGRGGQLLFAGAVRDHVAAGHEGELGGGEQPVAGDQLVRGGGPRGGDALLQQAGSARQRHRHPALTRRHERGGVHQRRDPESAGLACGRAEPEFQHGVGGGGTDDGVHLLHADARVAQRAQRRLEGDRDGIVAAGQTAGLGGVVGADDGDVSERMPHANPQRSPARRRNRCTLPLAVNGSSSTNTTWRGAL